MPPSAQSSDGPAEPGGTSTVGWPREQLDARIANDVLLDDAARQVARAAFPLGVAKVVVTDVAGAPGSYYELQTHPDDMPTEQFKMWHFTVQLADTKILGKKTAGWSLARNRPITESNRSSVCERPQWHSK